MVLLYVKKEQYEIDTDDSTDCFRSQELSSSPIFLQREKEEENKIVHEYNLPRENMILVKQLDENIVVWETEGQQGAEFFRVTLLCSPGHVLASSFMNTHYHGVYYLPGATDA